MISTEKQMPIIVNIEDLTPVSLFRAKYGLMVNDSLIAACMQGNGIKSLATNDAAFRKVNGLTIFSPEDIDL
jgi:predicted nucleic acid-binding protein